MSLSYGFCLDDFSSMYDSAQFAEAFRNIAGDGIDPQAGRFAAEIQGFGLSVASGYALKDGRFLESDEPVVLTLAAGLLLAGLCVALAALGVIPVRRWFARLRAVPHLFAKSMVLWCVACGTAASVYAMRILSRTGHDPAALLGVILAFFGGELLLMCLKTVLKNGKDDNHD